MSYRWFCSFNSVHALKTKWTIILIEINIGVKYSKPVYIIGCWNDTYSFMNGNICILKCITGIQNPGSLSMHSLDSNFYSEWVRMFHRTVWLVIINTFNLRTNIFTVECNKFLCIITVTFLNTRINEWTEEFYSFGVLFYWGGIRNKADILFLSYFTTKASFQSCIWGPFKPSPMSFYYGRFLWGRDSICETTGLNLSNIDQISSGSDRSSFCID